MPKVKVDDIQMYYEVNGEGYPLVMIMGGGGNLDWWNPHMIEELSNNSKVVTFDNRGTGRTDVSDKEFSIRLFADDTVGLMNALGISQANILGWSMGGIHSTRTDPQLPRESQETDPLLNQLWRREIGSKVSRSCSYAHARVCGRNVNRRGS